MGTAGLGDLGRGWTRNEGLHGKKKPWICLHQEIAQAQVGFCRQMEKKTL